MHRRLHFVALVRWDVRFVEVLVSLSPGRIAAPAAVAAALEAREARAAARKTAASASNDTPNDRQGNQSADDDDGDDGPSANRQSDRQPRNVHPSERLTTYLQYVASMQLSQLEKAVFTSATWPWRSRRSRAGRKLATSNSAKPSRKLLFIATSTAAISAAAARRLIPLFPLRDQAGFPSRNRFRLRAGNDENECRVRSGGGERDSGEGALWDVQRAKRVE